MSELTAAVIPECASLEWRSQDRRVPHLTDPARTRNEWQWWLQPSTSPSELFVGGERVPGGDCLGTCSLNVPAGCHAVGARVGLIDTGCTPDFEDLECAVTAGAKFFLAEGVVFGGYWADMDAAKSHGTRNACLIAGNGHRLRGVARGCELYVAATSTNDQDKAAAYKWLVACGCRVIVLPWGTARNSFFLRDAVEASYGKALLFCAAPNADSALDYPGAWSTALPLVVPVNSFGRDGLRAAPCPTDPRCLAGPGANIVSLEPGGLARYSYGTSYAAPLVAACAAVVAAAYPTQPIERVLEALAATADPDASGVRRVNLSAALAYPRPSVAIRPDGQGGVLVTPGGRPGWAYAVEESDAAGAPPTTALVVDGAGEAWFPATSACKFYRARVL